MVQGSSLFPPLAWGTAYRLHDLKGDALAGITIGIMGIPQGMAYALIAGVCIYFLKLSVDDKMCLWLIELAHQDCQP